MLVAVGVAKDPTAYQIKTFLPILRANDALSMLSAGV
jgi:hypothetical protein